MGLLQHIAFLYEQRGDMMEPQQGMNMPPAIKMLYQPYVVMGGLGSSSLMALG